LQKIYLVTYKFQHHYSISGYNRLADFIDCKKIVVPRLIAAFLQKTATLTHLEELKQTTGLTGYFPECVWLEWWTRTLAKLPSKAIFHFIYPENSYYFTGQYKKSTGTKIIATYHQPVHESHQFILKTDAIRKLDAVILLSESQREFFEPIVGNDRIFIVPHGIDLSFFTPPNKRSNEHRIVAVGNWLRDFPTLVSALKILQARGSDIVCDVVTLEQNRSFFNGLGNVQFHSGIADDALLELYHRASASVLSLTGTAANNALLESMACGLPIIATDLPAIREYTPAAGCRYVPLGDPNRLADSIISLVDDSKAQEVMGNANLKCAQKYRWEDIAKQTMDVYRMVEKG
jgi:glycosyltransferase involved in cell wall biosynthesis